MVYKMSLRKDRRGCSLRKGARRRRKIFYARKERRALNEILGDFRQAKVYMASWAIAQRECKNATGFS